MSALSETRTGQTSDLFQSSQTSGAHGDIDLVVRETGDQLARTAWIAFPSVKHCCDMNMGGGRTGAFDKSEGRAFIFCFELEERGTEMFTDCGMRSD